MKAFKKLFGRSSKDSKTQPRSTTTPSNAPPSKTTTTPPPTTTTTSAPTITTMAKQTIVVFGATGKQGGSVVKTILADPKTAAKYHIKAVTRDTTKESAQKLKELGAEVVSVRLRYYPNFYPSFTNNSLGRLERPRNPSSCPRGCIWRVLRYQLPREDGRCT